MTGMLIFIAVVLLIFGGLEVTHRRSVRAWHPGRDARADRDTARLADELRTVAHFGSAPALPGDLLHLASPTSAATDAPLITRTAA